MNCAECRAKYCSRGALNDDPACHCGDHTPAEMLDLYASEELEDIRISSLVASEGYGKHTRVEETMDYCFRMGYRHIGLAFCITLSREAETLSRIFKSNGFTVDSVCCKSGAISKTDIGITREQFSDPSREFEGMCNPAGQAKLLTEAGCDIAILLGLCVGHDTLFIKHCDIPCTVLAVKDRVLAHNPIGAVYAADSIYKRQYSFLKDRYGRDASDEYSE